MPGLNTYGLFLKGVFAEQISISRALLLTFSNLSPWLLLIKHTKCITIPFLPSNLDYVMKEWKNWKMKIACNLTYQYQSSQKMHKLLNRNKVLLMFLFRFKVQTFLWSIFTLGNEGSSIVLLGFHSLGESFGCILAWITKGSQPGRAFIS